MCPWVSALLVAGPGVDAALIKHTRSSHRLSCPRIHDIALLVLVHSIDLSRKHALHRYDSDHATGHAGKRGCYLLGHHLQQFESKDV